MTWALISQKVVLLPTCRLMLAQHWIWSDPQSWWVLPMLMAPPLWVIALRTMDELSWLQISMCIVHSLPLAGEVGLPSAAPAAWAYLRLFVVAVLLSGDLIGGTLVGAFGLLVVVDFATREDVLNYEIQWGIRVHIYSWLDYWMLLFFEWMNRVKMFRRRGLCLWTFCSVSFLPHLRNGIYEYKKRPKTMQKKRGTFWHKMLFCTHIVHLLLFFKVQVVVHKLIFFKIRFLGGSY